MKQLMKHRRSKRVQRDNGVNLGSMAVVGDENCIQMLQWQNIALNKKFKKKKKQFYLML